MTIVTKEKLKYRFEKIEDLTWVDRYSSWTPTHKNYVKFLKAIKKEYPTVKIETLPASTSHFYLSGDVQIVLKFNDLADEAEFILKESL